MAIQSILMKYVYLLYVLFLLSCQKEKREPQLVGKWTLIERLAGTGGGFITTTYSPLSEMSIQFLSDGTFTLTNHNGQIPSLTLSDFDRYQVLSTDKIRFYHSASGAEMDIYYDLTTQLRLDYPARCGFSETMLSVN